MMTQTGLEEWSAPEMLNNLAYNEKVDMWSAGCILYFILSGDQPFYSENIALKY